MIVDSSALVAIAHGEPQSAICFQALLDSQVSRISAANLLEALIVVEGFDDPVATSEFEELVVGFEIEIVPVTINQVRIAREGHRQFGKGRNYAARLNFGDCFAYALAKEFDEPLLFIGNDFIHTDVRRTLD